MKRTTLWLATGLLGLGLVGCNKTETSAPEEKEAYAPAEPTTEETASTDSATAAPQTEESQPQAGESQPLADESQPEAPTSGQAEASSAPQQPNDPLLEGIEQPQVLAQFAEIKTNAASNPSDALAQLNYAGILQFMGNEHAESERQEKADEAYLRSAEVVDALLETDAEMPEGVDRLLAMVYYNKAGVHARRQESPEALAALDKAVEKGFQEFDDLESDESMADLRAIPEFSDKLEGWKQAAAEAARAKAKEELAQGESFPFDFSLTTVDGQPIKLSDYAGKVMIVDIWGTWCPPCRAEIPSFIKLQETYGPQGFQMVGLNEEEGGMSEEAAAGVRKFMAENNMNYPCALIDEETKNQVPDFQGYPTTLFVDRTGKVRLKVVGLHDYEFLEAIVTTLLEEPAPEGAAPEAAATEPPATEAPASEEPVTEEPVTEEPVTEEPAAE